MDTLSDKFVLRSNALGGLTLYILPGADLAKVPSPFRELLTEDHAHLYAQPKEGFSALAERSALSGMRQWFTAMADGDKCGLQVHTAQMGPAAQSLVTARGLLPRGHSSYEFTLASRTVPYRLPSPLESVFRVIDGTLEGEAFEAGGIVVSSETLFDFTESYPIDTETCPVDLEGLTVFYRSPMGNYVVAEGETAFLFRHESCDFVRVGDVETIVNSYFTANLNATRWLGNFE